MDQNKVFFPAIYPSHRPRPISLFGLPSLSILILILGSNLGDTSSLADTFSATVKDNSTANAPDAKNPDASAPESNSTPGSTQKADETPHFWQRDSRGGFENEGRDYCCPVAVSNSFVYFARHGFPSLLPEGEGVQPQIDLINALASADYFGTDPENGTPPGDVINGVRKYIQDKGYGCKRLEYEGWRNVGKNPVKAARVNLEWLKKAIDDPAGTAWLNVGWYVHGATANDWKRVGGHWVTLVGYDTPEADGTEVFYIHNPLTKGKDDAPDNPAQDAIHLAPVDDGTLQVGKGATQDSQGIYQISGPGLPINQHVDAAFLDAAIVLVVKQ